MTKYADDIYDICVEKNINPIYCCAKAQRETQCGVGSNYQYNYWGIGVWEGHEGKSYSTLKERIWSIL